MSKNHENLFIYDGSCGFCVATIRRLKRHSGGIDFVASQSLSNSILETLRLRRSDLDQYAVFVTGNGRVLLGYDALLHAITNARGRKPLQIILSFPMFSKVGRMLYGQLALRRVLISRILRTARFAEYDG